MECVRVFLNPHSGNHSANRHRIEQAFAAHSIRALFSIVGPGLDVKAIAASDPESIPYIAAGGDGTVNCVASAVARSGRSMGVLALGTLNHFAHDLDLPTDLEPAVQLIAAGYTRPIDAAEVNGRIFVNNSSLGVYPRMVLQRERLKQSGINKWASLLLASLRAFVRFRCIQVQMNVQGQHQTCTTPFLFIGNNQYCLEGLSAATRKVLDGGQLGLYLAPGATRMNILRMALAALFGRLRQDPVYEERTTAAFSASITGRHRIYLALDGEVLRLPGPLHYRSLPGALRVFCPQPAESPA